MTMTETIFQEIEKRNEEELKVEPNRIHNELLKIGIPPNLLGYAYVIEAMQLILSNPSYMHLITKCLYVDIARKHNSTPQRVERAIRHAINHAWLNGNSEYIDHIFLNCVNPNKGVPTNSIFLSRMYYYICNMES